MKLTAAEWRIHCIVVDAVDEDLGVDTSSLLLRARIANRHILKVHVANMRRKGVRITGFKGGRHRGGYVMW